MNPSLVVEQKSQNHSSWGVQLPSFKRPDGRTSNLQIRPPACELGVLKNANGSARFRMGLTSVLAGVFGPRESPTSQRKGAFDKGTIQVVVRPLFGRKTLAEKYSESTLTSILSTVVQFGQLIRTTTTVVVQPEDNDGGLLSCSINAAMCAILDSGIPCRSTYLAVPLIRPLPYAMQRPFNSSPTCSSLTEEFRDYSLDPTIEEIMCTESLFDQSSYVSFVLDIHSGSLVQSGPEYLLPLQQHADPIDIVIDQSPLSWAKCWCSTTEMLDVASTCCKILAEVVRKSFEIRLSNAIVKTVTANNLMENKTT